VSQVCRSNIQLSTSQPMSFLRTFVVVSPIDPYCKVAL
jgi:hypothetical protein